jgi:hypothetical protein
MLTIPMAVKHKTHCQQMRFTKRFQEFVLEDVVSFFGDEGVYSEDRMKWHVSGLT